MFHYISMRFEKIIISNTAIFYNDFFRYYIIFVTCNKYFLKTHPLHKSTSIQQPSE